MIQQYDPEDSPYSFGTTPIYNTLFKLLTDKDDQTDIVMINVSTIVRNAASKQKLQDEYKEAKERSFPFDILSQDIVKETTKEVELLTNDIISMYNTKSSAVPRYIILYLGDYSKVVPNAYFRAAAAGKQHIDMADAKLKQLYRNNRSESVRDGIHVLEIFNCQTRTPPFRWLEKEIRYIKNQHNVIMISNHPLDYHIARYVGKWTDIKSFNGATQHLRDLGEKVLGYSFLPFTEKMHILVGDKTDLKPCLSQRARKELLAKAEADNWNLKSKDYVDRILSSLNFITPYAI